MSEPSFARGFCLGLLWTLAAAGCGGSSSETPWPVEPVDTDPTPVGETRGGHEEPEHDPAVGRSQDPESEPESEPEDEPTKEPTKEPAHGHEH